jgi:chemotaxis protein MotB
MSAKRGKQGGAPTWIVTFADLMSLLLALFVLLLSFAEMDAVRYERTAGSMRDAFGLQSITRLAGVFEVDGNPLRPNARDVAPMPVPQMPLGGSRAAPEQSGARATPPVPDTGTGSARQASDGPLYERLQQAIAEPDTESVVELEKQGGALVIRFPDDFAFPLGGAELSGSILQMLDRLGTVLESVDGEIIVAGHTDDSPIATVRFRSNWDLSTARAVSVIHHWLSSTRIDPDRLTAQGYADSRPRAPNDTAANRAINRRVEVVIRENGDTPPTSGAASETYIDTGSDGFRE